MTKAPETPAALGPAIEIPDYMRFPVDDLDTEDLIEGILLFGKLRHPPGPKDEYSVSSHEPKKPLGHMALLLRNKEGEDSGPHQFSVLVAAHGPSTREALEKLFLSARSAWFEGQ